MKTHAPLIASAIEKRKALVGWAYKTCVLYARQESWEDPLVYNLKRFEDDSNTDVKDQNFKFIRRKKRLPWFCFWISNGIEEEEAALVLLLN